MKMDNKDLRLTILGCFRYSLGRRTYMPSHTVKMIKNCQEVFESNDWRCFIREINDCHNLGGECDKETWGKLKKFAEDKIK